LSSSEGDTVTGDAAPEAEVEDAAVVDEAREALVTSLRAELGDAVADTHVDPGHEVWARVALDAWVTAGTYARDGLACNWFDFVSGIDWLPSPFGRDMDAQEDVLAGNEPPAERPTDIETGYAGGDTRFQLLARLHSPTRGHGLVLKADLGDDPDALTAPSWVPIFAGAEWHEREAWEMFGIVFEGHPHLRHLYLPGEFEGHPLRKDFPLLSRRVKPWPGIVDVEQMPGEEPADEDRADEAPEDAEAAE